LKLLRLQNQWRMTTIGTSFPYKFELRMTGSLPRMRLSGLVALSIQSHRIKYRLIRVSLLTPSDHVSTHFNIIKQTYYQKLDYIPL
jgi:hypothetical protein